MFYTLAASSPPARKLGINILRQHASPPKVATLSSALIRSKAGAVSITCCMDALYPTANESVAFWWDESNELHVNQFSLFLIFQMYKLGWDKLADIMKCLHFLNFELWELSLCNSMNKNGIKKKKDRSSSDIERGFPEKNRHHFVKS